MIQLEDVQSLSSDTRIPTDLCIIGSGPAGLSIARAFANTPIDVLVLESGRATEEAAIDGLGAIDNQGHARELDQTQVRNRIFGGSTQSWKGRCTSFSEADFALRDWVPNSGWPITMPEVEKYLDQAADYLELGPNIYDERLFDRLGVRPPPDLDNGDLDTVFWQFSKNLEFPFGRPPYNPLQVGQQFLRNPPTNVRILVNATVTHLNTNPEGTRISSLEVSSIEGKRVTVTPRATILCAGGIENARVLLASNRTRASGIGNAHDNVGRYLMDHLRVEVGELAPELAEKIRDYFEPYRLRSKAGNRAYMPGVALSMAKQREESLLNSSAWIEQKGAGEDDPWSAARSLLRGESRNRMGDLGIALGQPGFVTRGLYRSIVGRRGFSHKGGRFALVCMCEQIPDRESRVTLASRRDALGVPLSTIHWKVNDRELESLARTAELVAQAYQRRGLASIRLLDWVQRREFGAVIDVAHPTGTTRMSGDPRSGVVDTDCKVHGVDGLYIAGSSVFPTSGHANPTLMLVALALRLADHLKSTLFMSTLRKKTDPQPLFIPPPVAASANRGVRVLVTGGTGNIGRALVSELLRRNYDVRVVTSRKQFEIPGVEVRVMNWLETLDFAPHVEGCDAILHLGAELHDATRMQRVNVAATAALAAAAEASGVHFLGYASTVSVYGSPTSRVVTESSPVVDERGVKYLTAPYLQAYAATKLAGERRIREAAAKVSYVIYRPTVVVGADMLESLRNWSRADRIRYGARRTNHVYVGDVVQAMIWLMERDLAREGIAAGNVDVFNLSDESSSLSTYAALYGEVHRATADSRFRRAPLSMPPVCDVLRDALRYREFSIPPHYPLGLLRFPPQKLLNAGFRHPFGLTEYYRRSILSLKGSGCAESAGVGACERSD